jgi:2-dehydro-3-deoxyglucarate aldolase
VGFSRANLFGKHFDAYRDEAQAPLLVAMIEHARAIENLDSILAVPGLDALLVGPYDLSASMGMTAKFDDPVFKGAIDRILDLARKRGIACGIHVVSPSPDQLRERIAQGYRFLAYAIDAVFLIHSSKRVP